MSAALRALRESPSSPDAPPPPAAVRAAAELLLAYVTNALRDPRNPRVHRVRSGNPVFQRALGRLGGCEGAMTAVGFEPRDRGAVFVLREVGAGASASRAGTGKERQEVSTFVLPLMKAIEDIRSRFLPHRFNQHWWCCSGCQLTTFARGCELLTVYRLRPVDDSNLGDVLAPMFGVAVASSPSTCPSLPRRKINQNEITRDTVTKL